MTPYVADTDFTLWNGDCIEVLARMAPGSIDAVVTSPPYMDARPDYEPFTDYLNLWRGFERVVTGPVLLNVGRVWRNGFERLWWPPIVEYAAFEDWRLLDTLIWSKPNANPIQGQVLTNAHEYVLIFGRPGCAINEDSIRTPYAPETLRRYERGFAANSGVKGHSRPLHRRNRPVDADMLGARARSVVEFCTGTEKGNEHPAPMPAGLAGHLVSLATFPGQTVLDPFMGSGTTALVARKHGRRSIGIELNAAYCEMAARRLGQLSLLAEGTA